MALDPDFQTLIDQAKLKTTPALTTLPLSTMRQGYRDKYLSRGIKPVPSVSATDETISIDGNTITVRLYSPDRQNNADLPLIIYFHGGGYVLGDVASYHHQCQALAHQTQSQVMSVDYRLAPEHPYPAAVSDAIDCTRWAFQQPQRFTTIALAGDSAGGALALVASAYMAKQGKRPVLQALFYPWVDQTPTYQKTHYPSIDSFGSGYFLDKTLLDWFSREYCPKPESVTLPLVSPLYADHSNKLPPSLIFTAGCDPLRDMGAELAKRLLAAGVETKIINYPGLIHNFMGYAGLVTAAQDAFDDICQLIHHRLHCN